MNPRWLLNASRWARNPPSAKRVWLGLAVIAICLALAGAEHLFGLSVEADPAGPRPITQP
ncbi:hypothetical protein AN189_04265 [Loktanella sp. 3ANDIMAR09]|uniref:hypothetical protein n=1 Tax=Loktanella sp. 3ANDIMAR09 TaxID=1225657 RepID=UPI0006F73E02|nr:hypothetical protein [Loktanella sp. 3ANDIMAR09]KQI69616.1 hypothetical protein AN189_04265 [Loktanella sp. 3ANDIMAR09]